MNLHYDDEDDNDDNNNSGKSWDTQDTQEHTNNDDNDAKSWDTQDTQEETMNDDDNNDDTEQDNNQNMLDVNNYSMTDLFLFVGFDVPPYPTNEQIQLNCNTMIAEAISNSDTEMAQFILQVQSKLVAYTNGQETQDQDQKQNQEEEDDEQQEQKEDNNNNQNQNTSSSPSHDNTHILPVVPDKLNPTLKNIITLHVCLDSQYRNMPNKTALTSTELIQGVAYNNSSITINDTNTTDYTCDLSTTLLNVLNLRVFSVSIPYTWYAIDSSLNNNVFNIEKISMNVDNSTTTVLATYTITVQSGNYTGSDMATELQNAMLTAGFIPPTTATTFASFNNNSGTFTLNCLGWHDPNGDDVTPWQQNLTTTTNPVYYQYTFFTPSVVTAQTTMDSTLGYALGFRSASVIMTPQGNKAPETAQLIGTKYFIIAMDDYNQNHINNSVVTIGQYADQIVDMPSYFNPLQPSLRIMPQNSSTTTTSFNSSQYQYYLPAAPRNRVTQAQLYTINEILAARRSNNVVNNSSAASITSAVAPCISDTLAIVPIKYGMKTGDCFMDMSGSIQNNRREYFGPVNISKLRVRLLDDRGNVVNLHGGNWSLVLICECLYQY